MCASEMFCHTLTERFYVRQRVSLQIVKSDLSYNQVIPQQLTKRSPISINDNFIIAVFRQEVLWKNSTAYFETDQTQHKPHSVSQKLACAATTRKDPIINMLKLDWCPKLGEYICIKNTNSLQTNVYQWVWIKSMQGCELIKQTC